jgi:hypothetical protein
MKLGRLVFALIVLAGAASCESGGRFEGANHSRCMSYQSRSR